MLSLLNRYVILNEKSKDMAAAVEKYIILKRIHIRANHTSTIFDVEQLKI